MGKLFGTDGIRGKANVYPITPDIALKLGQAIAKMYSSKSEKNRPRAIIGKDTRLSGYMLESAIVSGLVSMGMDVFEVGPMPTPAVAHIVKSMAADCGIMVTASHNPADDNGMKIFSADGFKLPDEEEARIEQMIFEENMLSTSKIGKAYRIEDARGRYIEFAKSSIKNRNLKGIKAVLDCANGAAYFVAPLILKELGVETIVIANHPDGININDNCGATHTELLSKTVRSNKADIGIAVDGDADRIIFCDADGNVVNGDKIIGLCALDYHAQGKLANDSIVITNMSNLGLVEALTNAGIKVEFAAVGDRYVIEMMRDKGINLGGEQSGHIIFLDHVTTGDGIITALHVLKMMKEQGKSIKELANFMTEYPQELTSLYVREKKDIDTIPALKQVINDSQVALTGQGRIIVRYSGTENKIRVLVESKKSEDVKKWTDIICDVIKKEIGA